MLVLCADRGRITVAATAAAELQAGRDETAEAATQVGSGELGSAFTDTGKGGLTEDAAACCCYSGRILPCPALVCNQLFFQTKRKGWGDRDTIGGQGLPGSRFLNLQSGCTTAYAFLEKLF